MNKRYFERLLRSTATPGRLRKGRLALLPGARCRDHSARQQLRELQQAEAELHRLNQLHNDIFDNAPVAIYVVDRQLMVVKWNKYLEKLTGIGREQALGQNLLQLQPMQQGDGEVLQWVMREGEPYHQLARRIRFPGCDGEGVERYQDVTIYPLFDEDGRCSGAIGILADVTLRIQAQEKAREASLEVEKSRQHFDRFNRIVTMGELATTLAHELGQPITAIGSYAQAALNYAQDEFHGDKVRELLHKIVEQAGRAGECVEQARDRVRQYEVEPLPHDINLLLQRAATLAEVNMVSHGCEMQLLLSPVVLTVMVDRNQIEKVVLNLLRNAVEAVAELEPQRRQITLQVEGHGSDQVRITVRDRGDGVTADERPRLFEPFYTTKPQGLGIGLAICDSVVTAHGGSICYNDAPDGGAEFAIYLPRA